MKLIRLKPVPGYDEYYAVSEKGEVYSRDRVIELPGRKNRCVNGTELRQKSIGKGYRTVVLSRGGETKTQYVHRLVAGAFIKNPDNLPYVNHKDGNPSNNHATNLEWVTHGQNVQHAYDSGLNGNKGGTHGFAVGVIDNEIGERFDTVKEWADARGVKYSTARNVLNGYSKTKKISLTKIIKLGSNAEGINNK